MTSHRSLPYILAIIVAAMLALGTATRGADNGGSSQAVPKSFTDIWHTDPAAMRQSDSLYAAAMERYDGGDFAAAADLFAQCHRLDSVIFHPDHPTRNYAEWWWGESLRRLGDAMGYALHGTAIEGRPVDRRRLTVCDSLTTLANHVAANDMAWALRLYLEDLPLEREAVGHDHPFYANSLHTLSVIYQNLGREDEAIAPAREAAAIRLGYYGEKSPQYVGALSTLALALHRSSSRDSVEASIPVRLKIIELNRALGDTTGNQLEYVYLAHAARTAGVTAKATADTERYLRDALTYLSLSGQTEKYRDLHRELYERLGNMFANRNLQTDTDTASPEQQLDNELNALDCYRHALTLGLDSATVVASHLRLGQIYMRLRDSGKAIGNLELVVDYQRRHQDLYGAYLPVSLFNLGSAYNAATRFDPAITLLKEAIDRTTRIHGEEFADVAAMKTQLCMSYMAKADYANARRYGEEAMQTVRRTSGEKSLEYAASLRYLAGITAQSGYVIKGLDYLAEAIDIMKLHFAPGSRSLLSMMEELATERINADHPDWEKAYADLRQAHAASEATDPAFEARILRTGARGYENHGDYTRALECVDSAIAVLDAADKGLSLADYALTCRVHKANLLGALARHDEALGLLDSLIADSSIPETSKVAAHGARAQIYSRLQRYSDAIADTETAIRLRSEYLGDPMSMYNLDDYENLALYHVMSADYAAADSMRRTELAIVEKQMGRDCLPYLNCLTRIESTPVYGNPYRLRDNQMKVLEFARENYGDNSVRYATELVNTADVMSRIGLYREALGFARQGCDMMLALSGERDESYLGSLVSLSTHCMGAGDYENGRATALRAISLSEKYHPGNKLRIANAMQNVVNSYFDTFDYGSALYESRRMAEYTRLNFGETSSQHLGTLAAMANIDYNLGDYNAVKNDATKVIDLAARSEAFDRHVHRQSATNILSLTALSTGNTAAAVKIADTMLGNTDRLTPANIKSALHNASYIYFADGQTDRALALSDSLMAMPGHELLDPSVHANMLMKQGYLQAMSGRRERGIALMERAMAMRDSIYGGQGRYVLLGLRDFMTVSDTLGDTAARDRYALRYSDVARQYVRRSFLTLSAGARQLLWDQYSDFMMNEFPAYAAANPTAEMTSTAYDNLLLGKGLMLNTQREITDIISDSDDPAVKETYAAYRLNRQLLDRLATADRSAMAVDADSLARVVASQEYDLQRLCGDFTRPLAVGWQDVCAALGPDDAAVEFTTAAGSDGRDRYMALVLRPGAKAPALVTLPETQLTDIWKKTPDRLAARIWQPLADAIGTARNVYFSAAGDIHSIPVESLADWQDTGRLVSDRWALSRLSSTRELALDRTRRNIGNAVIYGGLRYDTDPATMEADARRYADITRSRAASARRDLDLDALFTSADTTLRAGASYLPATLDEAREIYASLTGRKIDATFYSDTLGTETSFKALSGTGRNLPHIATHGFSWSRRDARRLSRLKFLNFNDDTPVMEEDRALARCGLLFAGANNALQGREIPDGIDDGILSAREIADLDFRHLDLLIMSACETGLGDITGEGVFGLQRGFKKAGAGAIMMSLWKVDDRATHLLMTKFYEHLLAGADKRRALTLAQQYLRDYTAPADTIPTSHASDLSVSADDGDDGDDGTLTASQRRRRRLSAPTAADTPAAPVHPYASPRYWAAFILLDALD